MTSLGQEELATLRADVAALSPEKLVDEFGGAESDLGVALADDGWLTVRENERREALRAELLRRLKA